MIEPEGLENYEVLPPIALDAAIDALTTMEAEQSAEVVGNDIGEAVESTYEGVIAFDHLEDIQRDGNLKKKTFTISSMSSRDKNLFSESL